MAKVIRNRWVFRPHGRWHRYLPRRNDAVKEYDLEEAGGTLSHFRAAAMNAGADLAAPSKLWVAWLYRDLATEPKWTKAKVEKLFGAEPKLGKMHIFKNTEATNNELWDVKHLIELKPVSFPNGEPTEADIGQIQVFPDGRCMIAPEVAVNEEELKLFDESKQFTRRELGSRLASKYYGYKDVFETNVYTPSNISVVK